MSAPYEVLFNRYYINTSKVRIALYYTPRTLCYVGSKPGVLNINERWDLAWKNATQRRSKLLIIVVLV
jgi:hypothetical protein